MNASPFERMGGEPGVRALVDAFYDHMELDGEFAGIRALHPEDLTESRNKLFWFLCGWLGGPNHYIERFGHPRLRARHLPFPIGTAERDQWLACMARAVADCALEPGLGQWFMTQVQGTADWMRNRAD
ncbi:MAG: group II truncated hemoglobin [Casimicrobiaceae bacterium]